MSIRDRKKGAADAAAPRPPKEQDVKIPVEVDETAETGADAAQDAPSVEDAPEDAAVEPEGMTEEEMVEAAIRAGEEAAEDDFKQQLERVREELADVRRELEGAVSAKDAAEASARDAVDRTARLQADWENYRRRTAQERLAERARATEGLVEALLPVIDDMERALAHARATEMAGEMEQFVNGVDAVHTKMLDVLAKEGVEVIDPAGEPFDPIEHQAVGRVEDASQYEETVNDVYQKGYRMGDHVIRSAMVTVAYGGGRRPDPEAQEGDAQGDSPEDAAGAPEA